MTWQSSVETRFKYKEEIHLASTSFYSLSKNSKIREKFKTMKVLLVVFSVVGLSLAVNIPFAITFD